MASDPSKTEKGTAKRRKKARKDGSVAKSQDLTQAFTLIAGLYLLRGLIGHMNDEISSLYRWFIINSSSFVVDKNTIYNLLIMVAERLAYILLPFMIPMCFIAWLVLRLQVGKLWAPKVFEFKFGKIFNIMNGLKKLFIDPKTFIRLGKSILQALVVGIAPYIILKNEIHNFLPLFYSTPRGIAVYILERAFDLVYYTLLPMILIGVGDFFYQRYDYEENLKMTKDEVKDERKQAEGDPQIKSQQRQKMMAVMQQRMLQDVPKADVVITNPTHYAVALRYNALEAPAPLVLAKGVDHLAEKIRDIATEHRIPIRRNPPLARALYDQVEIGDIIPEEMYRAVASILAQLNKMGQQRG